MHSLHQVFFTGLMNKRKSRSRGQRFGPWSPPGPKDTGLDGVNTFVRTQRTMGPRPLSGFISPPHPIAPPDSLGDLPQTGPVDPYGQSVGPTEEETRRGRTRTSTHSLSTTTGGVGTWVYESGGVSSPSGLGVSPSATHKCGHGSRSQRGATEV